MRHHSDGRCLIPSLLPLAVIAFHSFHPERPTCVSHSAYINISQYAKSNKTIYDHKKFKTFSSAISLKTHAHTIPELVSLSIIVQTVKGHFEDLICLTQAIPGTVVTLVHFNGMPDNVFKEKNKTGRNLNHETY